MLPGMAMAAQDPTQWWQVVGAVSSAIAAIAAAFSAFNSRRAASASQATGRDALEALALGIQPHLYVGLSTTKASDGTVGAAADIRNMSAFAASDLRLVIRYRDGTSKEHRRELLDPARPSNPGDPWQQPWWVDLEGVRLGSPPDNSYPGNVYDLVESVEVTYSDHRDIARYELRVPSSNVEGVLPLDSRRESSERRIR
jgi:hypothetical protein